MKIKVKQIFTDRIIPVKAPRNGMLNWKQELREEKYHALNNAKRNGELINYGFNIEQEEARRGEY